MLKRLLFCVLVGALGACSSEPEEPDWQFGAADVEAALVGTWTGTWSAAGKTGSMELVLARSAPTAATKCGSRTLSGTLAPKCLETSTVSFAGTLTTSDGTFTKTAMTGTLMVDGTRFSNGELSLRTSDGRVLGAQYGGASTLTYGRVGLSAGEAQFTLNRAP